SHDRRLKRQSSCIKTIGQIDKQAIGKGNIAGIGERQFKKNQDSLYIGGRLRALIKHTPGRIGRFQRRTKARQTIGGRRSTGLLKKQQLSRRRRCSLAGSKGGKACGTGGGIAIKIKSGRLSP